MGTTSSSPVLLDPASLRRGTSGGVHKSDLIGGSRVALQSVYQLQRQIGQGAFGVVYEAQQIKSRQTVVCKVIQKSRVGDDNLIRNEIELLKALDHPHILRIYDYFEHGGPSDPAFYLICEVCNGGNLQEELSRHRGGLPVAQAARYMRQVLLAMNYCHSLAIPVIHRDLKPGNVMKINSSSSSDVKIIDFGLATLSEGHGSVCGTPEFMAPEVWTGIYGQEADCWSIGMMLYHLLVAALPFKPPRDTAIYARMWKIWALKFPSDQGWSNRGLRSARDLIRSLLELHPRVRMTAASALKSEFIKKHGKSKGVGGEVGAAMAGVRRNIQNFSASPKLVEGLRTYSEMPRVMRVVLLMNACKMDIGELAKVREVFDSMDRDGDGFISHEDMTAFLQGWMSRMGRLAAALKAFSLPKAKQNVDSRKLLRLADLDEDGSIGYTEFLVVWLYANQKNGDSCLRAAFQSLQGPDGRVSQAEVRDALCSKQMQQLGADRQMAADIAAIFPPGERMTFERFQECLQRQEDLGAGVYAIRPAEEGAVATSCWPNSPGKRGTWTLLGSGAGEDYEGDDSDLDRTDRDLWSCVSDFPFCCCPPEGEHHRDLRYI